MKRTLIFAAALLATLPLGAQAATLSTNASASANAAVVHFVEPARLFGIFAIKVPATASIDAGGRVTLSHPWYFAFATPGVNEQGLRATLSTEAAAVFNREPSRAAIGATSTAGAEEPLTAEEQQALTAGIELALSGALPASTTAPASPSAAASTTTSVNVTLP